MPDTLFLCRPCAENMKSFQTVRYVKQGRSRRYKDTCEQCARRRFGSLCEVEFQLPDASILSVTF